MIALTPKMRIQIAIQPVDMRNRIDGLGRIVREVLSSDPFSGVTYVFRSRSARDIVLLKYDGQGFVMTQKRMSRGKFKHWPTSPVSDARSKMLLAQELHTLIWGGDPATGEIAPMWRPVPMESLEDAAPSWLPPPDAAPPAGVPASARLARAADSSSFSSVPM